MCEYICRHGGARAADFCAANLHKEAERVYNTAINTNEPRQRISDALFQAFKTADANFLASHPEHRLDGTTASVAIVSPLGGDQSLMTPMDIPANEVSREPVALLTVGHVGDTRILLCDSISGRAQQLTIDHTPCSKDERQRIENAGGFVVADSFGQLAVMGMLATSRNIGAPSLKKLGDMVTSDPQLVSRYLHSWDTFLVLVSDGSSQIFSILLLMHRCHYRHE